MKLPKQVPAVERKVNKHAAVPAGANVRPAGWFDDIVDTVRKYGPAVLEIGKGIGSAL